MEQLKKLPLPLNINSMWKYIVRLILRQRVWLLVVLGLTTAFMAYQALQIKMSYQMAQMLPDNDSTVIRYNNFKKIFQKSPYEMLIIFAIHDSRKINQH